jgi:hypothetical protein
MQKSLSQIRVVFVVMAMGPMGLLASCSDDTSEVVIANERLATGLLTVEDLGEGWAETQRTRFEMREPENPSIDPSLWCPQADRTALRLVDLAGDAGVDVEFEKVSKGSSRYVRLQAWSNTEVGDFMTAVDKALAECDGVAWNDGSGTTYTITALRAPTVGDEVINWEIDIITGTPTGEVASLSRMSVFRIGEAVGVIQEGGMGDAGATTNDDRTALIVMAADKLAGSLTVS